MSIYALFLNKEFSTNARSPAGTPFRGYIFKPSVAFLYKPLSSLLLPVSCHNEKSDIPEQTTSRLLTLPLVSPVYRLASCEEKKDEGTNKNEALTTVDRLAMKPVESKNSVTLAEVESFIQSQQPMDRLKQMYTRSPLGEFSPELEMVWSLSKNTAFIMFLIMSVMGSRAAREAHIRKVKHVKYETKFQALRAYHDAVFFGGLKAGMLWAAKTGFFTALFLLTSQSIAVYRNKTSVIEYIIGGGVTCALLRFNVGPRGMLAGGIIGSGLGLVGGTGFFALFKSLGETQEKRNFKLVQERLNEMREIEELTASASQESVVLPAVVTSVVTPSTA